MTKFEYTDEKRYEQDAKDKQNELALCYRQRRPNNVTRCRGFTEATEDSKRPSLIHICVEGRNHYAI